MPVGGGELGSKKLSRILEIIILCCLGNIAAIAFSAHIMKSVSELIGAIVAIVTVVAWAVVIALIGGRYILHEQR